MTRPTTVPPPVAPGMVPGAPTGSSTRFGRPGTASATASAGALADGEAFDAWQSLAAWLREGRLERGLSIADVARTTKIQARILEDLEVGNSEDLPADVFVRGFIRNYARCVGLSETEALARYAACGRDVGPVASPAATAVAELYAPQMRKPRMSTVVPVAPGSPAAEVHAQGGHSVRRAATQPGFARAATSPGIAPHAYPRAMTSPAVRATGPVTAQMAAVGPGWPVAEPAHEVPTETTTAASSVAEAAIAASPVAAAPAVVPSTTPADAAVACVIEPAPAVAVGAQPVEVAARAPAARKRRGRSKRREERAAQRRAQTVRPPDELEIFESVDAAAALAAEGSPVPSASDITPSVAAADELGAPVAPAAAEPVSISAPVAPAAAEPVSISAPVVEQATVEAATAALEPGEVWIPRMPAPAPRRASTAMPVMMPSLVIDDADPEVASRVQEGRRSRDGRDPTRRTFLPPILLESQDRAHRQGGLTLAVIILLIAATLTLSYLMRRPSSGGGGMTSLPSAPTLVG